MELVTPTDGRRTLWCELSEVIDSGLLSEYNNFIIGIIYLFLFFPNIYILLLLLLLRV